jgi:site-specific recombinase XerD
MRRFVLFHAKRHPRDMSATEIKVFLSHLAIAGKVSASIRNPAKSALRFLYRQVLKIDETWLTDIAAVRKGKRLPGVLTVAEVQAAPCSRASSNGGSINSSSIVGLLRLAMGSSSDRAFQSRRDPLQAWATSLGQRLTEMYL